MRPSGRDPTLIAPRGPATRRLWRRARLYAVAVGIVLSAAAPGLAQTDSSAPPRPDTAYFEFLHGRYLENQGKLPEALEAYERAAVLDPKSAQIRAEIAGLYARQNKSPEAVRDAKRALELDPKCTEAHWVLGTIYATMLEARREASSSSGPGGEPSAPSGPGAAGAEAPGESAASAGVERASVELAIEHLEKARPGRMFDNGLHVTLGRLYLARRNWDKAIQVLSFVVEREPEAVEAGYLLSQAYDGAGRRAEAIAGLEQVVAIEPRFFRGLLDLADLYVRDRRWEAAADAYGRAATEYPDNVDLQASTRGRARQRR